MGNVIETETKQYETEDEIVQSNDIKDHRRREEVDEESTSSNVDDDGLTWKSFLAGLGIESNNDSSSTLGGSSDDEDNGQEFDINDYETVKQRDEKIKRQQTKRKKRLCYGLLISFIILLILIPSIIGSKLRRKNNASNDDGTTNSTLNNNNTNIIDDINESLSSSSLSSQEQEQEQEVSFSQKIPPRLSPTLRPTTIQPTTIQPTKNPIYDELINIIGPITNRNLLSDITTPQGKAFDRLYNEVTTHTSKFTPIDVGGQQLLHIRQRYVLLVLYYSTDGDNSWYTNYGWSSYNSNNEYEGECTWYGVANCLDLTFVTSIHLESNNLVGTIPSELCTISNQLDRLDLSNNPLIIGSIPSCLMNL